MGHMFTQAAWWWWERWWEDKEFECFFLGCFWDAVDSDQMQLLYRWGVKRMKQIGLRSPPNQTQWVKTFQWTPWDPFDWLSAPGLVKVTKGLWGERKPWTARKSTSVNKGHLSLSSALIFLGCSASFLLSALGPDSAWSLSWCFRVAGKGGNKDFSLGFHACRVQEELQSALGGAAVLHRRAAVAGTLHRGLPGNAFPGATPHAGRIQPWLCNLPNTFKVGFDPLILFELMPKSY